MHTANLVRVPSITNVSPWTIYNLASVDQILVTGRDFLNSENLICLIRNKYKIRAIFESDNSMICRFKG